MWTPSPGENADEKLITEVYQTTDIVRKPITGIVSGYHELPYILVSPDDEDTYKTVRIEGRIRVSPRFILTAEQLGEQFSEVFDPETFSDNLQGRLFSFAYHRKKNIKLESEQFEIKNYNERPREHLDRTHDDLMRSESVDTALIFGPRFDFYPVSIDRFVNEIVEREFNV